MTVTVVVDDGALAVALTNSADKPAVYVQAVLDNYFASFAAMAKSARAATLVTAYDAAAAPAQDAVQQTLAVKIAADGTAGR